jgi:nucleotide-binding universal stress UspA family protein
MAALEAERYVGASGGHSVVRSGDLTASLRRGLFVSLHHWSSKMKTVLVALDGSTRAQGVLEAGVVQAKMIGAKLVLLGAVGVPVDLPATAIAMSPEDVLKVLEQRARLDLEGLSRAAGVPCEIRIETGSAWQAICHTAKTVGADLIVIGSHGYGGLDRVLGTTAARVVNHADRSVLVVRAPAPAIAGVATSA